VAEAVIQVGADHGVPVAGQPVGELPVELVPARHVMHGHDPGPRLVPGRPDHVGVDLIPATTGIGDDLRGEAVAVIGLKRVPHGAVAYRACPEPVMTGCVMAAGDPGAREMIAGP